MILHWNGKAWTRVTSPGGIDTFVGAVAVASASSAWADGEQTSTPPVPFLLHWNGTAWKRAPSPLSAAYDFLNGMATVSARSLWVVGSNFNTGKLISMHWNGTAWKQVPTPGTGELIAAAAPPGGNAWAIGWTGRLPLILHWNGKAWGRVSSPSPAGGSSLNGVAAVSARSAWAVGSTLLNTSGPKTLILQWNGTVWK